MNILAALKAFFSRRPAPDFPPSANEAALAAAYEEHLAAGEARYTAYKAQVANDFRPAEAASSRFEQQYGEFTGFLYRPEFDAFLREQVLFFWEPGTGNKEFLDDDHWAERHPFNFPGPFYAGESDTCCTGIVEAPDNVIIDANGCEYIFKQPTDYQELRGVLNAAAVEVLASYSSNGNDYWTSAMCKEWWRNRAPLLHHLTSQKVIENNEGQAQRYLEYLNGGAEMDLRRYCYFLENGAYPANDQVVLPAL